MLCLYIVIGEVLPGVSAAEFQKVSEEGMGLEVWPFAPGFVKQTGFIPSINTEGEHT